MLCSKHYFIIIIIIIIFVTFQVLHHLIHNIGFANVTANHFIK
jgi:hypothetical protein